MQRKWALVKYYQKSKWLIEWKNIKIIRLIRDYKITSMQGILILLIKKFK